MSDGADVAKQCECPLKYPFVFAASSRSLHGWLAERKIGLQQKHDE